VRYAARLRARQHRRRLRFKYKLANSGTTHVVPGDGAACDATAPVRQLDAFALEAVDFLKIDCEGYELPVVVGGEQTIRRWGPTIIVEQKPNIPQRYGFDQFGAVRVAELGRLARI
jgi:FkbM family methyltransferase